MKNEGKVPSLIDFLEQDVYPALDRAVVFRDLDPEDKGTYYLLRCPSCGKREAFVYKDGYALKCNRLNNCGFSVSLLSYVDGGDPSPRGQDFVEALRKLSNLAGVPFPERKLADKDVEKLQKEETRRSVLEALSSYAQQVLWSARGDAARRYLIEERGVREKEIRSLNLGFYPSVSEVRNFLKSQGLDLKNAKASGVLWTKLEGYILIPWADDYGRPLTIYGRWNTKVPPKGFEKTIALPGEGTKASPLYFDRARRAGHKDLVLVEGAFDAGLPQLRGDTRAIACLAAQLSRKQAETLARHKVQSVTICLDPDSAGDKGTLSCIKALEHVGITAYVAPWMPDGMDPDEFVLRYGIERWKEHIDQAVHAYRYIAKNIITRHRSQGEWTDRKRSQTLNEAVFFHASKPEEKRFDLDQFFWPEIYQQLELDREALIPLLSEAKEGRQSSKITIHTLDKQETEESDWEAPTPFYEYDLPEFPTNYLPSWIKNFVEAEATATQTPTDLGALLTLSLSAAALAKKVKICVKPGYFEPINLFTVTALPPGSRKSTVFSAVVGPLEEYEDQEIERKQPEVEEAATRHRILEKALAKAENDAAKASSRQEREKLSEEATRIARELTESPVPILPRFLADDTTPERLSTLLKEHKGKMAVFSPEGGVFDLMGGRYSATGAPNFDVYLKGHAGDNLRVDRVGRPPEYVSAPALTLGLTVQPDVLQGLIDRPGFRGRGLLGRFLYALPKSLLGKRDIDSPPVPSASKVAYCEGVTALLSLPNATDQEGKPTEHILQLSSSGRSELRNFEAEIEPQLAPFGELGNMTDWAGKLLGAVARIAAILHVSEHVHYPKPWKLLIEKETIERAIRIGRYLIPHAQAAYSEMGADSLVEDTKHVLAWIQRKSVKTFTKRELYQGTKGRFKRVSALEPALELLCEHGFIREQISEVRTGPGRRPSSIFEVNPKG